MFLNDIRKQCCIARSIEEKCADVDNKCLDCAQKKEILLNGKKFSDYETYEVLVQASLLLPFLIIFLTQIILMSITKSRVDIYTSWAYTVFFAAFTYVVYLVIDARHNKEYKINNLLISIGAILLMLIAFLHINDFLTIVTEYKYWIILFLLYIIYVNWAVWKRNKEGCKKQDIVTTFFIDLLYGAISVQLFLCCYVDRKELGFNYAYWTVFLLYMFMTAILFFHNKLLSLIKSNDDRIEMFRRINGDYIKGELDTVYDGESKPY